VESCFVFWWDASAPKPSWWTPTCMAAWMWALRRGLRSTVQPLGGGSIHVWGGITCNNKTRLVVFDRNVNAEVYVIQVLADFVLPFMQNNYPYGDGTLQQNDARPHTARATQQFLAQHNINVLEWATRHVTYRTFKGWSQTACLRSRATAH